MTIRILLVDDHSVVRQGLRMFLGLDPELEVIGEAADGAGLAETRALIFELRPESLQTEGLAALTRQADSLRAR